MSRHKGNVVGAFWAKVDKTNSCWLWIASKNPQGYGQYVVARKMNKAHRFAYRLLVGEIPEGLQLDHLCRIRHCVNPDHLEPVTQQENCRRGARPGPKLKTHCKQGHKLTPDSVYYYPNLRRRECKTCRARHYIRR